MQERTLPVVFAIAFSWSKMALNGLVAVLLLNAPPTLDAQQLPSVSASDSMLQAAGGEKSRELPGSISGTVQDTQGSVIAGAQVAVIGHDHVVTGEMTADDKGVFRFADLAPGSYQLSIYAAGFEPFASAIVVVSAGERRELPAIALRILPKNTAVDVTATLSEVAQEQVKEAEQQRIIGLLPNYFTSYIWNAAPIRPKQKFDMAVRTVVDPVAFLIVGGIAGVEQSHKTFPGYGQGAAGYAKRFGSAYADTVSARMLGSAVFPTLLHQDPRYYYRGSGSVRTRLLYALVSTVVCRGDNGQLEPNYSHVLGSFAAAGISNILSIARRPASWSHFQEWVDYHREWSSCKSATRVRFAGVDAKCSSVCKREALVGISTTPELTYQECPRSGCCYPQWRGGS